MSSNDLSGGYIMELVNDYRPSERQSWLSILASLLPLWLVSAAIMAEGFPSPPVPVNLAVASLCVAIAVSPVLLWKGWMNVELVLYSLFPFVFLETFDEITTTYKTSFIILCVLILTAGAAVYQRITAVWWRWIFLLAAATLAYAAANHAAFGFWEMAADLGYEQCFPDYSTCAPLAGRGSPWWSLFFGF
jgi:hypothetical protein